MLFSELAENQHHPPAPAWRLLELFLRVADLLFIPELLMGLNRLFKPGSRRLNDREMALARSVFGDSIEYQKVWLDERSYLGCRRNRFAYVGFRFINCWGPLSDAHFIHEMMHVWQYRRFGSVYIGRSLWAQRTPEGYDYGGIPALRRARENGLKLTDFNYEQQADIVADYFCLRNGLNPRWCTSDTDALPLFERLVEELETSGGRC